MFVLVFQLDITQYVLLSGAITVACLSDKGPVKIHVRQNFIESPYTATNIFYPAYRRPLNLLRLVDNITNTIGIPQKDGALFCGGSFLCLYCVVMVLVSLSWLSLLLLSSSS